jgi:hypothetical protein
MTIDLNSLMVDDSVVNTNISTRNQDSKKIFDIKSANSQLTIWGYGANTKIQSRFEIISCDFECIRLWFDRLGSDGNTMIIVDLNLSSQHSQIVNQIDDVRFNSCLIQCYVVLTIRVKCKIRQNCFCRRHTKFFENDMWLGMAFFLINFYIILIGEFNTALI